MKVIHLLDSIDRGGAEMIALDVCRNAKRFGIDLTVAVSNSGALESEFENSGADFVKLKRRFPVDLLLIKKLRQIIKSKNIEIVHGYQAVEGLHLYFATIGLPVKRVLSFQGLIASKKDILAAKFLLPRMDANIVVSKGFENWLKKSFNIAAIPNSHIIYNCADAARLAPQGNSIKKEIGAEHNDFLLGMVANFHHDGRKDQLTVCRSLPTVFREFTNAHFVFAGKTAPGGEAILNECKRICETNGIGDRVHFLGGRSDVPDILSELDVFVFSSLYEGSPIAVAEAMLAGVPVIVSDIEPLLEASDSGKCAEVFPARNAEILSAKIIKLLKDNELRRKLAKLALDFARENFTIDAHLRELKKLYETLLDKRP